ncbi:MAG: Asp-tRNA(Asn)/Glu-tRNA(Gln) amidotransferase subunit GatC [Methanocalculus sp. MSAO_Arc2]|uniref:Asp-tRNA(Asn)/Glu-tRNA(Gln) amidotransferase subunit GatC n=1 Tax=Methanocalculus sp. MSAO_Arc2 TaxID=2293855 RepID=UPI000FEF15EF|nr:MAG: Asp-tRNA(Asn)/Glu-tRNA(Gln) amidotransferase subunit GatC [Methanocalculus sp. MSAO_Arc2]
MVSKDEVAHSATIADIEIDASELERFTEQFNTILEYFDILDAVWGRDQGDNHRYNVFREDTVAPSLSQEEVLRNSTSPEDGFIRAPRVI